MYIVKRNSMIQEAWMKVRKRHIMEKPFTCAYCENKFNDSKKVKEHEKNKHNGKTIYLHVDIVKRIWMIQKMWRNIRKTNKMEKPFTCGYCEKKFSNSRNMKEHEKNKHNGKTVYMCIMWQ